jgi:uncharacterized protein YfeS
MKKYVLSALYFTQILVYGQVQKTQDLAFDLLHTELKLKPIWNNQTLEGTATLTLKPYFYE